MLAGNAASQSRCSRVCLTRLPTILAGEFLCSQVSAALLSLRVPSYPQGCCKQEQIDSLGPLGPFFFVTSVAAAEMIPLFPTQPLSLAGGIAFGAAKVHSQLASCPLKPCSCHSNRAQPSLVQPGSKYKLLFNPDKLSAMQGSVLVLSANLTAGLLSFTLARTIGRQLAQKVIQEEVGEGEGKAGVRAALQKVEDTIESGTFAQQCTSILLLRLTPIVPFRCCTGHWS